MGAIGANLLFLVALILGSGPLAFGDEIQITVPPVVTPDQKTTEAWILAHAIRDMGTKHNSDLFFFATQLGRVTDEKSLKTAIERSRNNGGATQIVSDKQTVEYISEGLKKRLPVGGELVDIGKDAINGWLEKPVEQRMQSPFPVEGQMALLYENIQKLPSDLRTEALRELAKKIGVDYDVLLDKAEKDRIAYEQYNLNTQTLVTGEAPTSTLLTEYKAESIKKVNEVLDETASELEPMSAKELEEAQDKEDQEALLLWDQGERQKQLDTEVAHQKAGNQLIGYILAPIIGAEDTRKVTTVGSSLIQMNQAIKQYGPGGVTPDQLLMCTTFVGAAMVIADMYMQQSDPTMEMMQSMMKQLREIQIQLGRIEGKIDTLSNLVLEGFNTVLVNQVFTINQLADFKKTFIDDKNERAAKEAIGDFINYVEARDAKAYEVANECASLLIDETFNLNSCKRKFAQDLATISIYSAEKVPNTPAIFSSKLTNLFLSTGAPSEVAVGQVGLEQLSRPFFFTERTDSLWAMVSRNHEAVAAIANRLYKVKHPKILASPEVLSQELRTLLKSAELHPELINDPANAEIFLQAKDRITDIERFMADTAANPEFMNMLIDDLGKSMDAYEKRVADISNELLAGDFSADITALTGSFMFGCGQAQGIAPQRPVATIPPSKYPQTGKNENFQPFPPGLMEEAEKSQPDLMLPESFNGKNIGNTFDHDNIFFVAQRLGFIRLGHCYEWKGVGDASFIFDRQSANYAMSFTIKDYFEFTPRANAELGIDTPQMRDGRPMLTDKSYILRLMTLPSATTSNTHNMSMPVAVTNSWIGTNPNGFQTTDFPGSTQKAFLQYMQSRTNRDHYYDMRAKVTKVMQNEFLKALQNRTKIWSPSTLELIESSPSSFFQDRAFMTGDGLSQAIEHYSLKYLLFKNLLLMSAYHENPTSECHAALDVFNPFMASSMAIQRHFTVDPMEPLSVKLKKDLKQVAQKCVATRALSRELTDIKRRLEKIH